MMHDRAWRALGAASLTSLLVACAGGETPATDAELREQIASRFVDGVGLGTAGASNAGSGGRGGSGGSAQAEAGAAGDGGEPVGGGGSAAGGSGSSDECNGFQVLADNCGSSGCHGEGSVYSDFAASEAAALEFVDESGVSSCADEGPLLNPDNPAASILIQKVTASSPPCGAPMPIVGELSQADVTCLQEWISTL
jgi:hypothetical protein